MFLMEDGCCENSAVFSTSDRVINNPKPRQSNMLIKVTVGLLVGVLGYVYQAIKPPIPKPCGSLDGPPVSSPRIRLSDGRYLAYKESGVPKSKARFKIIVVHGFNDAKDFYLPASKEVVEELGVYLLTFDRPGYGESDPNPKRSVKSEAFDIQELADQLELGSKFYVVGVSLGGYPVWGYLKYIPNRIAGASLVAPIINYWWPSFPSNVSKMAYKKLLLQDQWIFRVAHYAPKLLYWWYTQKWFPSMSSMEEGCLENPAVFSASDRVILRRMIDNPKPGQEKVNQQGIYESLIRDMMVGFGKWDFDPLELESPVQVWQGCEDRIVSCQIQRYVAERLPWIKYYEISDGGHLLPHNTTVVDAVLRSLLIAEEPSFI